MPNVTLKDIYDVVNRLEDKVDCRLTAVEKSVDELQSFQNKVLGIASIAAIFVSAIVTYVWNRIVGK